MLENREVILSLRGISKIYTMGEIKFYALNQLDLDIYKGEFLVVLGPSGSGKSTLINIIGGTDRSSEGTIHFKDQDLSKASDFVLTAYRREEVGYIFQFYNLLPTLTALENVEVATAIAKHPLDPIETLKLVEMQEYVNYFPSQLSGGQQQRVAIARALASNPSLLLCDEPTGALDSKASQKVLDLLVDLCHRLHKNVVMITHNRDLAEIGNRMIELMDGKIVNVIEK